MKIKEYFGSISQLEKKLSAWIDLPISLQYAPQGQETLHFFLKVLAKKRLLVFLKILFNSLNMLLWVIDKMIFMEIF